MKTIFVVEQGDYADYCVVGIFTTRENAQLVCDAINKSDSRRGDATVDEWPIDPGVSELNRGHRQYDVTMRRDGTVERCERHEELMSSDINGDFRMWRRSQASAFRGTNSEDALQATVWAIDDAYAVKIVNERRTALIASGEWDKEKTT